MRNHLFTCIEKKRFSMFPHLTDEDNVMLSGRVLHTDVDELFYSCKLITLVCTLNALVAQNGFTPCVKPLDICLR